MEREEVTEGRMIGRGKEGEMKEGERRREWSESRDDFSSPLPPFFSQHGCKILPS